MARTRKRAMDLEGGDIIFDEAGERIGILLDDAHPTRNLSGIAVSFDVMLDDHVTSKCYGCRFELETETWRPSEAV